MELKKAAMAGTVESSDAQITVEPGTNGIELNIESSVIQQYGRQIKAVVLETLKKLDVKNAKVSVVDKRCTRLHAESTCRRRRFPLHQ